MTQNKTDTPLGESQSEHKVRRFMLWFFGFVVVAGGLGFSYKLYEFIQDLTKTEGLRFAGAHILIYLLVAGGFMLLLAFAFMTGHFANIEKAKFEMLEEQCERDRQEFAELGPLSRLAAEDEA